MLKREIPGPSFAALQPLKKGAARAMPRFPVYKDLVGTLAKPTEHPDEEGVVPHVLATLSAYAYSDGDTLAMIATRLGLENNLCLRIGQEVDAMFICSTAYLLQSEDGRVAILCYRGTEPLNPINWLTDADVSPEKISFKAGGQLVGVHGGFYRNVRATEVQIADALRLALQGKPIFTGKRAGTKQLERLEALYITGHSLGGSMAALMGAILAMDPDYADAAKVLRAVYTYGQTMIGDPDLAKECQAALGERTLRYIYRHDFAPTFPPCASGRFAHFGRELRYGKKHDGSSEESWEDYSGQPTRQMPFIPLGALSSVSAFVARMFWLTRNWSFPYSLYDHGPQHYLAALAPEDVHSEFGD